MNSFFLIKLASTVIAAFSQILLKISANKTYKSKIFELLNPLVIGSYAIFVVTMLMSVYSLKGISISMSNVIESFSYILIPVISYIFLKEKITRTQQIGILVIILGIIIFMI
ncbi:MAG: EamA family transporter [Erysipelotrichaceae bacterium]|nr:EamA family transporter [Erysipelotrichaceae bacterium]